MSPCAGGSPRSFILGPRSNQRRTRKGDFPPPPTTNNQQSTTNNPMNTNITYMTVALFAALAITGCKKDKEDDTVTPPIVNEEEVITTMILSFDGQAGVADKELRFTDPDGDGGAAPFFNLDTLQDFSSYNVSITLLNETVTPADTISNEVLEEGTDHQFFFQPGAVNVSVVYSDTDLNGQPIGLQSGWTVGAASSDSIRVTLRHEPNKSASGVSDGDITNAGGETDIEVKFPLVIE